MLESGIVNLGVVLNFPSDLLKIGYPFHHLFLLEVKRLSNLLILKEDFIYKS